MLTSFYLARSLPVAPPPQDQRAAIAQEYGNLPVRFEANDGQSKSDARFIARGVGYGVYLTPTEAALVLSDTMNPMPDAAVHIRLAGSNSDPVMSAGSQLEARTNYLIGNDRTKWRTGVKNYDSVRHAMSIRESTSITATSGSWSTTSPSLRVPILREYAWNSKGSIAWTSTPTAIGDLFLRVRDCLFASASCRSRSANSRAKSFVFAFQLFVGVPDLLPFRPRRASHGTPNRINLYRPLNCYDDSQ